MSGVEKRAIDPRYRKDDGIFVVDIDQKADLFNFEAKERSVVYIPPLRTAGNHSHPRSEAFICLGDEVEVHWLDENKKHQSELMNPDGQLYIFSIHPHVAHAVRNNSKNKPAILIEYASGPQVPEDVTRIKVL